MNIGPPPKPIMQPDGKEYFEAEPIREHLRELRTALARCEFRIADKQREVDHWKLIATGPR